MSLSSGLKKKLKPKNNFLPKKKGALPKIIVVLGPTSSGKTDLAIKLAQKFDAEIISADSRQVYRGLNIGSGKAPISYERSESTKSSIPLFRRKSGVAMYYKKIRHHLLDVADPKKTFTVAQYQKLAKKALADILKRGKIPIICGGAGFYIDALLYDYKLPSVAPQKKLRQKLERQSAAKLFEQLKKIDPERAKTIDSKNKRRLVRALEIILATGQPVPKIKMEKNHHILKIGLNPNPEKLRLKINQRLQKRLRQGMVKEVKKLHQQGLGWRRMEELGLEYRYLSRYLQGFISHQTMVEILQKQIWQYAKRQLTWFFAKNKPASTEKIHWFDSGTGKDFQKIVKLCKKFF